VGTDLSYRGGHAIWKVHVSTRGAQRIASPPVDCHVRQPQLLVRQDNAHVLVEYRPVGIEPMGLAVRPELPLHDEAGVRLQDRAPPTSIAAGPGIVPDRLCRPRPRTPPLSGYRTRMRPHTPSYCPPRRPKRVGVREERDLRQALASLSARWSASNTQTSARPLAERRGPDRRASSGAVGSRDDARLAFGPAKTMSRGSSLRGACR